MSTASSEVTGIYELLVAILVNLSIDDNFCMKRVNKCFRDVIETSPQLRTQLQDWLKPPLRENTIIQLHPIFASLDFDHVKLQLVRPTCNRMSFDYQFFISFDSVAAIHRFASRGACPTLWSRVPAILTNTDSNHTWRVTHHQAVGDPNDSDFYTDYVVFRSGPVTVEAVLKKVAAWALKFSEEALIHDRELDDWYVWVCLERPDS